jgi:hypothetical protein
VLHLELELKHKYRWGLAEVPLSRHVGAESFSSLPFARPHNSGPNIFTRV